MFTMLDHEVDCCCQDWHVHERADRGIGSAEHRGAKDDAKVGGIHSVGCAMCGHTLQMRHQEGQSGVMYLRQLFHKLMKLGGWLGEMGGREGSQRGRGMGEMKRGKHD